MAEIGVKTDVALISDTETVCDSGMKLEVS